MMRKPRGGGKWAASISLGAVGKRAAPPRASVARKSEADAERASERPNRDLYRWRWRHPSGRRERRTRPGARRLDGPEPRDQEGDAHQAVDACEHEERAAVVLVPLPRIGEVDRADDGVEGARAEDDPACDRAADAVHARPRHGGRRRRGYRSHERRLIDAGWRRRGRLVGRGLRRHEGEGERGRQTETTRHGLRFAPHAGIVPSRRTGRQRRA